jgi:hypothetical protein
MTIVLTTVGIITLFVGLTWGVGGKAELGWLGIKVGDNYRALAAEGRVPNDPAPAAELLSGVGPRLASTRTNEAIAITLTGALEVICGFLWRRQTARAIERPDH